MKKFLPTSNFQLPTSTNRNSGFSLMMVLITTGIVLTLTTMIAAMLVSELQSLDRYFKTSDAYALAKEGINVGIANLNADRFPAPEPGSNVSSITGRKMKDGHELGSYTVTFNTESKALSSTATIKARNNNIIKRITTKLIEDPKTYKFEESFSSQTYKDAATTADWTDSGVTKLKKDDLTPKTLDSAGRVGEMDSLAVDSNNKVHISYYDGTDGNLKYATNATGSWVYTTLDSTGVVGWQTSIALDSSNKVHISYYNLNVVNADLKYATNATGSWVYTTVDTGLGDTRFTGPTSIAIDSSNKVHIAYMDYSDGDLKYATNATGSWVRSILDSTGNVGFNPSLALDSNNKSHIAYVDWTNYDLKYVTNISGSWVRSTLDSTGNVGGASSLALDSNNKVHISYFDETNRDLKHATNSSGSWVYNTLDSTGDVGRGTSITLDSNNKVYIAYYTGYLSVGLKYATNASGSWVYTSLDNNLGSMSQYWHDVSLALGRYNKSRKYNNSILFLSYSDGLNQNLKYITSGYQSPKVSQSVTVDGTPSDISKATLNAFETLNGQSVSYQLSRDGGFTWENVTKDEELIFTSISSEKSKLRWKATLNTADVAVTPIIDHVSITYTSGPKYKVDYSSWRAD